MKYSEDEPRDDHGRWTDGGGGGDSEAVGFVSPSVTDKNFATAVGDLSGARQEAFAEASAAVDRELGLAGTQSHVVGAWADGAENSTMIETSATHYETMRLALAMKGDLANQKAVLAFKPDPAGPHVLYETHVSGDLATIHADLLKSGVAFHTLQPLGDGARVLTVDLDGTSGAKIGQFAADHGDVTVIARAGHAEFIGDQQGTGTDAEQRARASAAYQSIIDSGTSQHSGSDARGIWDSIRHRYSAALKSAQASRVKYSDDQPRDDHGRWTDAGGGGSGGGDTTAAGLHARNIPTARSVKNGWIKNSGITTKAELFDGAPANKAALDSVGSDVAAETGAKYLAPGLKKDNARIEIKAERRGYAGITDVVRSTFSVDTPAQANAVVAALAAKMPITDEGYKATDVGYFDRAVNVRFPNGQIGEVLIAPPELIQAKSPDGGNGHGLYVEYRDLPKSDPRKAELMAQSRVIYSTAYDKLSPDWKAAFGKAVK